MFKYLNKINAALNNAINLNKNMNLIIRSNILLNEALTSQAKLTCPSVNPTEKQLIISLTTYGQRIKNVYLTLESIAQQTVKPNKVVLWLDENEFSCSELPEILKRYETRGVEINFCKNYGSYKKLIPTVQMYPRDNVITIDDDIIYPFDLIENLIKASCDKPSSIIGSRAHKILHNNNKILPYKKWEKCTSADCGDFLFITTGGGTLFPAGCFPIEAFDFEQIKSICPHADDVWIKVLSLKYNIENNLVNGAESFDNRAIFIQDYQDESLKIKNLYGSGNDSQLNAALKHFGLKFPNE